MRQISLKIKYALTAIVELAERYNEGPVQSRVLAIENNMPHNYLEQVLVDLKRGGFVVSFRGSQGGYQLTRDPIDISIADIVNFLDGPVQLSRTKAHNGLSFFWDDAQEKVNHIFNKSLRALVEEKQRQEKVLMYTI